MLGKQTQQPGQASERSAHRRWGVARYGALLSGALLSGALLSGCKRQAAAEPGVVRAETPADEIMRVGLRWRATEEAKGFNSPPAPISVFDTRVESELRFEPGVKYAVESLKAVENYELRDGSRVNCEAAAQVRSRLRFGRIAGEAVVQVERPAVRLNRRCGGAAAPATAGLAPSVARFVLRGDQLVAIEPPLEKRVYLPLP